MDAEGYWQYGHQVWQCSNQEEHNQDCDQVNCEMVTAPESVIDLHNEAIEWTKHGMVIQGIPKALQGGPFPGISVEMFEVECRLAGLIKYLEEELPDFDLGKASDHYRKVMIEKLQLTRQQFELAKAREEIAVAKTPLLGPNGEVIH